MKCYSTLIPICALLIFNVAFNIQHVYAYDVDVTVIIKEIIEIDGFGWLDDPDFYTKVIINGKVFNNKNSPTIDMYDDNNHIRPDWKFTETVSADIESVDITIKVFDADTGLFLGDDHADLTSSDTRDLHLTVNLKPCFIDNGVSCDDTHTSQGTSEDSVKIKYKVQISYPAADPSGLRLNCIHEPILPSINDDVKITVTALTKNPDGTSSIINANELEIWVYDTSGPTENISDSKSLSLTTNFEGVLIYNCVVKNDATVSSGWRMVNVVNSEMAAIPVLYNDGGQSSNFDIVFIPEKNDFTSYDDEAFLNYVEIGIQEWIKYDVIRSNIHRVNFWIAKDMGEITPSMDSKNNPLGCDSDGPQNWYDEYTFADSGVIVHEDDNRKFRDCRPGGENYHTWMANSAMGDDIGDQKFTSSGKTLRHEAGHVIFGLSDEYNGAFNYFESEYVPNVYEELSDCEVDNPSMRNCRTIEDTDGWISDTWYTSDPMEDDLMKDNGQPRDLDNRRMLWMFDCIVVGVEDGDCTDI